VNKPEKPMTVAGLLRFARESGAGVAKIITRDKNDQPTTAVIAVLGVSETREMLAAIAAVEAIWDEQREQKEKEASS